MKQQKSWSRQQLEVAQKGKRGLRQKREDGLYVGSEDAMQADFFYWVKLHEHLDPRLKYIHSIPNAGLRSKMTRYVMMLTGMRAGVPDIHVPFVGHTEYAGYTALWIELKSKKGTVSPEQQDFLQMMNTSGQLAVVIREDWTLVADLVIRYLGLDRIGIKKP